MKDTFDLRPSIHPSIYPRINASARLMPSALAGFVGLSLDPKRENRTGFRHSIGADDASRHPDGGAKFGK